MALDMAQVYTDFSGLAALRARARDDQDATLDQVSRQFESLFLQMMLKNMRDASFGGGIFESPQTEFYREMYDKQLAMDLADGGGIGLAAVIRQQIGGADTAMPEGMRVSDYSAAPLRSRSSGPSGVAATPGARPDPVSPGRRLDGSPAAFLDYLWPVAEQAAARLDLSPEALLAQAALETGWGRHVMRRADGSSSHNLFGIKADRRWDGDVVQSETREYRDGVALSTRANFRAYASYAESFADYVDFVQLNPRYAQALQQVGDTGAYFRALQAAGYATDPNYAAKIERILVSEPMQHARIGVDGRGS